jgi:hypothetical protein
MNADALICSHPRSGGRWLRFLLAHYLAARNDLDLDVTPQTVFSVVPDHRQESARGYPAFRHGRRRDLPLLAVCHSAYSWELHRGFPIVFLARNAYDVVVSAYYHLSNEKGQYAGSMRSFIDDPRMGLTTWLSYVNRWAPHLLLHRDAVFIAYRELDADPGLVLRRVLTFLDVDPDPALVGAAVARSQALRDERIIRTGQEGTFWDHLQPEEIFDVQAKVHTTLSEFGEELLRTMGVELDPFPRSIL